MKRLRLLWGLLATLLLLAAAPQEAEATHVQAADITYRWLAPNKYRIYLRVYRDRRTGSAAAPTAASVDYRNARLGGCTTGGTQALSLLYPVSFDSLGSNLCSDLLNQFNGQPPFGSDIVTFSGELTLPGRSDRWIVSYDLNARPALTNIVNAGSSDMYTYCIINNSLVAGQYDVRNSTIQFATNPSQSLAESKQNPLTFRTCLGQPYELNFNFINPSYGQFAAAEAQANDATLNPTGDSLAFSLVAPATPNTTTAPGCSTNMTYYSWGSGGVFTPVTIVDSASQNPVTASWAVSRYSFSPTQPLPSHTMSKPAFIPNIGWFVTGQPYFEFNRQTGLLRFRPSAYNINGLPTATDPNDKYAVCFLVEEYRKIRITRQDQNGDNYLKDTTIFVGAARREALIFVGECPGNVPPGNTGVTFNPPRSGAESDIKDSLTRIVVRTCNSTYATLRFEDRGSTGSSANNVKVQWINPFPAGNKFAGAIRTQILSNNSPLVTAFISIQGIPDLAPRKDVRDSVELVFLVSDEQCPNPAQAFRRARIVFERRDSVAVATSLDGKPLDSLQVCVGETIELKVRNPRPDSTDENPAQYRYEWVNPVGFVPGTQGSVIDRSVNPPVYVHNDTVITVRPAVTADYIALIKDIRWKNQFTGENKCVDTGRIHVDVVYPVTPEFSLNYARHLDGGKKGISAPLYVTINNNTPMGMIDSLTWTLRHQILGSNGDVINETDLGVFSTDTFPAPLNLDLEGRYIITATSSRRVNNIPTCVTSYSDTITIPLGGVPNTITPNGDGQNERLVLTSRPNVMSFDLYNRWGTKVYSRDNYFNEFDGKDKSGRELPAGVYFYTVTNKETNTSTKYWLQILR